MVMKSLFLSLVLASALTYSVLCGTNNSSQQCCSARCDCSENPLTDMMPEGDKIRRRPRVSMFGDEDEEEDEIEAEWEDGEDDDEDVSMYSRSWDL